MKKAVKELLTEQFVNEYLRNKTELIKDVADLTGLILMFEVKYGIKLQIVYEK